MRNYFAACVDIKLVLRKFVLFSHEMKFSENVLIDTDTGLDAGGNEGRNLKKLKKKLESTYYCNYAKNRF